GPARPRTTALLAQDLVQAAGAVEVRARPWATAAADFLLPQGKAAPRRQAHAIVCRDQCFARVTGPAHLLDLLGPEQEQPVTGRAERNRQHPGQSARLEPGPCPVIGGDGVRDGRSTLCRRP